MKLLIAALVISAGAWGQNPTQTCYGPPCSTGTVYLPDAKQKPCVGGENIKNADDCVPVAQYVKQQLEAGHPAPLKCGKWERFEAAHGEGSENGLMATMVPDRCVPILHTVTEREWAELMERLNTLEVIALTPCSSDNYGQAYKDRSAKSDPWWACTPNGWIHVMGDFGKDVKPFGPPIKPKSLK